MRSRQLRPGLLSRSTATIIGSGQSLVKGRKLEYGRKQEQQDQPIIPEGG